MHQLAIDERDSFPAGSVALQQNFDVDDFISGCSSVGGSIEKMRRPLRYQLEVTSSYEKGAPATPRF